MPDLTTDAFTRSSRRTFPTGSVTRLLFWRAVFVAAVLVAPTAFAAEVIQRGAPLPLDSKVIPLASVIANPKGFTQEEFVTEGTVRKVCRLAGCWMSIAPGGSSKALRVTFKRGAFVVPRSSAGSHARLMGKVRVADDAVTFVASGLEMTAKPK